MIPTLEITFQDIVGDPWEGKAIARFQGEPGEPFVVSEGMDGKQRENTRWYIEDYMDFPEGGNDTKAYRIEKALQSYGKALWSGIESSQLQAWLGAVQVAGKGRLELRAAEIKDEVAFRTPWELMRVGGGTLLHQLGVTVVRRSKANLPGLQLLDTSKGLRILAIVCRPEDAGFLDPRYTPEAILTALENRPEVSIDFCRPATLAALVDLLQEAQDDDSPYHVVHFDGHGTTIPYEGGIGALCFEKTDGTLDLVRATQFGDLMARFRIPLVVLEACRTATKVLAQETVAGALLRQGVGTVVAMGHAVHVDMTCKLMGGFYSSIARGRSLGEALQAARNQIYADKHRRMRITPDAPTIELNDWFVPQLYQSQDDPKLLTKKLTKRKNKSKLLFAGFINAPRAGFQGRGYELHRLERVIEQKRIVVIYAPGGMGKTALSREAALWWTQTGMFPDGAIFVSLEGNVSPQTLISKVGEALEGIKFHQRKNPADWLAKQLNKRQMLIIWDNYESVLPAFNEDQPTPPEFTELAEKWTAGSSRLLITCRDAQVGLAPRGNPAWPFPLGELTLSEGLQLLIGLLENLGIDRAERTRRGWNVKLLKPIVKKTGGHPLALELLAPHIIKLGPQKVAQEVGSLLAKTEQDVMEDRNRSIQASLDFSIKHLSEKSRAALPAISLLAGGCLDITANSVVGLKEDDWAEVKTELERTGLLRSSGNFLQPHPILAEIRALEPKSKLIEHFIHNVAALCNLYRQYIDSDLSKSMMELLENSETVVRRGIYYAIRTENAELSMYVSNTLTDFLNRSGRGGESKLIIQQLKEKIQTLNQETKINSQEPTRLDVKVAFEAASARASEDSKESLKDLQNLLNQLNGIRSWDTKYLRTSILREIGSIYTNYRHEPAKAIEPLREAIMLNEQLEKEGLQNSNKRAATLGSLGAALIDLHRLDEAHIVLQQKLTLNRELDNKQGISSSFHELGIVSMHQGKFKEAERYFREALDFASKAGDKTGMGAIWQKLGAVSDYQRDHNTAFEYFQKAYYAFQKGGEMQGARQALNSLGIVELKRGYNNSAITWFERSLQIAEELDDLSGQAFSLKNIAFVLSQQAEQAKNSATYLTLLEKAISNDKKALAIHEQLGQLKAIADSQNNLAATLLQAGKIDEAEEYAQKSLSFRESINDPNLWQPLSTLEEIAETRGDNTNASQYRRRMEAARKESKQRAGSPALPQQTVLQLLKLSLTARSRGDSMETALASVKAKEGLMEVLEQNYSWLAINLRALASGQNRPIGVEVPPSYQDLLTQVWDSVS